MKRDKDLEMLYENMYEQEYEQDDYDMESQYLGELERRGRKLLHSHIALVCPDGRARDIDRKTEFELLSPIFSLATKTTGLPNSYMDDAWGLIHRSDEELAAKIVDTYNQANAGRADKCQLKVLPIAKVGEKFMKRDEKLELIYEGIIKENEGSSPPSDNLKFEFALDIYNRRGSGDPRRIRESQFMQIRSGLGKQSGSSGDWTIAGVLQDIKSLHDTHTFVTQINILVEMKSDLHPDDNGIVSKRRRAEELAKEYNVEKELRDLIYGILSNGSSTSSKDFDLYPFVEFSL